MVGKREEQDQLMDFGIQSSMQRRTFPGFC